MFVATLLIYGDYYGIFGIFGSIAIIMVNYGKNMETIRGFLYSSVGKESACNTGDPGSIPGLGRSSGEGIGYPLLYSWASLVAQLIKNPSAMQETWVRSLGWDDPLEKEMAAHSSILAWRNPWIV